MKKLILTTVLIMSITSCNLLASNQPQDYQVKSIYDGDTMRVINNKNKELKIRFACIDARELKQKGGTEDRDFVRKLVKDNGDRVKLNITGKDRYDRIIAEVYINKGLLQEIQVKNGRAFSYPKYKNDCPHFDTIAKAEKLAIAKKLGLWSEKNVINPSDFRKLKK